MAYCQQWSLSTLSSSLFYRLWYVFCFLYKGLSLTLHPLTTQQQPTPTMQPLFNKLFDNWQPKIFIPALSQCALCFFMFSWHVHEKAVLMISLPLWYLIYFYFFLNNLDVHFFFVSLIAGTDKNYARIYFFLSTLANYSLFPLLFKSPGNTPFMIFKYSNILC